jgi:hypothetical protein
MSTTKPLPLQKVEPADERPHPPAMTDLSWNESFYMNFFDTTGQWGGTTRLGISPNRGVTDGIVCLYFPNGAVGVILLLDKSAQREQAIHSLGLSQEVLEPLKRWRVRYQGDIYYFDNPSDVAIFTKVGLFDLPRKHVEFELEFQGIHEPHHHPTYKNIKTPFVNHLRSLKTPIQTLNRLAAFPKQLEQAKKTTANHHYEQAGLIRGTIKINGEESHFEGSGQRDHSWGIREWWIPTAWRWFTCQFGTELAFNAFSLDILGSHFINGYIWNQNKFVEVKEFVLTNTFDKDNLGGKQIELSLKTAEGKQFNITGEVKTNIPISLVGENALSTYTIGQALFQWNNLTGYGVSEFLDRVYP